MLQFRFHRTDFRGTCAPLRRASANHQPRTRRSVDANCVYPDFLEVRCTFHEHLDTSCGWLPCVDQLLQSRRSKEGSATSPVTQARATRKCYTSTCCFLASIFAHGASVGERFEELSEAVGSKQIGAVLLVSWRPLVTSLSKPSTSIFEKQLKPFPPIAHGCAKKNI